MTSRVARVTTRFLLAAVVPAALAVLAGGAGAAPAPVGLGTAESFALLAGATVTNTGSSVIFQAGSTLISAPNSRVALVNGASPCNVFWQVGSSATLDTGSVFVGTILALTSVSAKTSVSVTGRLLARNGAVTLDTNRVTRPAGCSTTAPVSSTMTAEAPLQGLFTLGARLTETSDGGPIGGRTVVFSTATGTIGVAVTDADGAARMSGLGAVAQIVVENGYTASFGGDSRFMASSARPTLLAGATGSSQQTPAPASATGWGEAMATLPAAPTSRPGRLAATGGTFGVREWGLVLLVLGGLTAVGRLALGRRSDPEGG